ARRRWSNVIHGESLTARCPFARTLLRPFGHGPQSAEHSMHFRYLLDPEMPHTSPTCGGTAPRIHLCLRWIEGPPLWLNSMSSAFRRLNGRASVPASLPLSLVSFRGFRS